MSQQTHEENTKFQIKIDKIAKINDIINKYYTKPNYRYTNPSHKLIHVYTCLSLQKIDLSDMGNMDFQYLRALLAISDITKSEYNFDLDLEDQSDGVIGLIFYHLEILDKNFIDV
jgi:hypothetical protein